ncbi:bifunctional diaminohydroxyphosphoribosylaminopyrimidine deaminase/5-amino-6-(5-phosphoribosylamino)uracil reductase RibD [Roseovarius sp. 2305UL8-3]|uniref:bifunctional diaminohydroxyphosphoribosylaminopyrimidine deaminase/5-amino-6-(5-phosphoribosylamino)uracil reductase RibD n=1 Tax=Roseovarius conchicola TaxID=3121636 RepID=UPI0035274688
MSTTDTTHMTLALALGRRAQGATWPNPAVGCVIVKDDQIIGQGRTAPGGRPHAETIALAEAGAAAKGATAYVTLEPCAHHGQTPPCAQALIDAGVARVVSTIEDSDPRVSGQGFDMLRDAGITVETGLLADIAAQDLAGFFHRVTYGRPRLTLKLATSLDGRIATASGHSQWITGPEARAEVHAMRAFHDAVMVGAGTARADDPSLTVRDVESDHQPIRVVISRRLDLPLMSQLARTAKDLPVWICHGPDADAALVEAWDGLGAKLIPCRLTGQQLDMSSVLQELGQLGLTRVFCEGGGALAASLLSSDLVDDFVGFTAGLAIGAEGLPAIGALGLSRLDEALRFDLVECRAIGNDILHRWTRA